MKHYILNSKHTGPQVLVKHFNIPLFFVLTRISMLVQQPLDPVALFLCVCFSCHFYNIYSVDVISHTCTYFLYLIINHINKTISPVFHLLHFIVAYLILSVNNLMFVTFLYKTINLLSWFCTRSSTWTITRQIKKTS